MYPQLDNESGGSITKESNSFNDLDVNSSSRVARLRIKQAKTLKIKTVIIITLIVLVLTCIAFGYIFYKNKALINSNRIIPLTTPPKILFSIYEGKNKFLRPIAVAVNKDGKIYVSNNSLHTVEIVSASGKPEDYFGGQGSAKGKMFYPYGLGILPNGNILVAETGNYQIQEFSPDGKFAGSYLTKSNAVGIVKPGSICVDSKGIVYIGDISGNQVIVLDHNRSVIRRIKAIQFPHGIAVDEKGHRLYISDAGQASIKVYDLEKPNSTILKEIKNWKPNSRFSMVRGVAVDARSRLYVVDAISSIIRVFDKNGEYLFSFGKQGLKDGEFLYPNGICIDSQDRIYIADWGNNRVQVWGY